MIDFDVAYDKLAGLESSREIADFLIDYEIKAYPKRPKQCAISVWMKSQTGRDVSTNRFTVRAIEYILEAVDKDERYYKAISEDMLYYKTIENTEKPLTPAMKQFTCDFDCKVYPELIAEDVTSASETFFPPETELLKSWVILKRRGE